MGKTVTWKEAADECTSTGMELASAADVCTNGIPDVVATSDTWVPVADKVNEWISVSVNDKARLCKTHCDNFGGCPSWGVLKAPVDYRGLVMCTPRKGRNMLVA